VSENDSNEP